MDLSQYTDVLSKVIVVFQAFPKNDPIHKGEEFKRFRRKTKTLELYLVLDYERVMAGTDDENLIYLKEIFIAGCERFLKSLN